MPVFNAIRPGYPFSQVFETDPGAIPAGAELWLNLVRSDRPSQTALAAVTLVRESPVRFRLDLTAGQTGPIKEGMVSGDFILRVGTVSQPLNWRVHVPVVRAL
jgi:hypothetical protein